MKTFLKAASLSTCLVALVATAQVDGFPNLVSDAEAQAKNGGGGGENRSGGNGGASLLCCGTAAAAGGTRAIQLVMKISGHLLVCIRHF